MKGIDILFCSSQAATSIRSTMEGVSSSSTSALSSPSSSSALLLGGGGGGGGRVIDRHNPIIRDSKRYVSRSVPPCVVGSQPPVSPKPHKVLAHKKLKNAVKKAPLKVIDDRAKIKTENISDKAGDEEIKSSSKTTSGVRKNWSCTKPGEFISPGNSARYLLSGSDKFLLHSFSEYEQSIPSEKAKEAAVENTEKNPDSSSASMHQVVVLRVSLQWHYAGVTSFNIDFAAKKVTVTGNITPLEVLSSISKVKNAQLWSPTLQANVPTANTNNSNSGFKNEHKGAIFT